jgi:hypothetical protein
VKEKECEQQMKVKEKEFEQVKYEFNAIQMSLSWKITHPLRKIKSFLKLFKA